MEVNPTLFKNILNTLPVSYYAKRNLTVELDEEGNATYFNPLEDAITIGYNTMSHMFEKLFNPKELESCVRALLYHEISHSLLTPARLKDYWCGIAQQLIGDVINIFEDERIETMLKDYYHGVDFKRNCVLLNNYTGQAPTNAMEAFYYTVRFRDGKPEFVPRVHQIIQAYSYIKYMTTSYTNYQDQIYLLFLDVCKDWLEENEKEELDKAAGGDYDGKSESEKQKAVADLLNKEYNKGKFGSTLEVTFGEIDPSAPATGEEISEEQLKEILGKIKLNAGDKDVVEKPQKMLDTILNKFINPELTDSIAMLFENFTSRQKNNAGAVQRYSGVLNPRAIGVRKDWRVWEYKSQNGPVNGYDKLHLNLFIDTSGSFHNNEDSVNTLLKSLDQLEKRYDFFEWDLVTCQCGETLRTKKERYIRTGGGNNLDNKVDDIFRRLQSPTAVNYNILLLDGYAWTDVYRGTASESEKNIKTFNSTKCSIISDKDNEDAIRKYAPLAHTIIVKDSGRAKSYSEMLNENVLTAIQRALL